MSLTAAEKEKIRTIAFTAPVLPGGSRQAISAKISALSDDDARALIAKQEKNDALDAQIAELRAQKVRLF